MSTRALIGRTEPGGRYAARWLHWGDSPDRLIPLLRRIWTGTFDSHEPHLIEALLAHDWSELSAEARDGHRPGTRAVPGIGYTTDQPGDHPLWQGAVTDPVEQQLEWLYLIDGFHRRVHVYEATVHDRWLLNSSHHLDPAAADAVLGCGGHRYQGHRWEPAKVRWDGYEPVYDAQVCAGTHFGGHTIARFTDDVATAIADHTEVACTEAPTTAGPAPYLAYDGAEFNIVWYHGSGRGEPLRVARDADDRLLIGAYLLPWRRVDA